MVGDAQRRRLPDPGPPRAAGPGHARCRSPAWNGSAGGPSSARSPSPSRRYLLIGEISKVNLLGTLRHTNLGWFAVAVAASALTYFAAAANLAAFVPKRLSPIRGFLVQLSTAFVGVAMPPSVGHVAVNARYLHRQDVDEGSITAAVTLSQLVNMVTTVLLLVALGLLTGSGLSRFKIVPGADVLIALAVIAAAAVILISIPQTRAQLNRIVWPFLRGIWPRFLDALCPPAAARGQRGREPAAHRRLPGGLLCVALCGGCPPGDPSRRSRLPRR